MKMNDHFGDLLKKLIEQDGRHARQLEKVSAQIFGELHKVHHNNISRWVRGEVKRPRHWQPIFKLAVVLRLTEQEINQLLAAARYPTLDKLKSSVTKKSDEALLSHWQLSNPASSWAPPFQAPPNLVHFTGRQEELHKLSNVLQQDQALRVCHLQGMGGVGKTSIATYLAYELRPHFPDGVLWVSLPHSNTMSVLHSFAEAYRVDVTQYTDLGSRSSKVRSLLADKRVLIILDDAVNDEEIWPLLPPTGPSAVIITTRHRDLATADSAFCMSVEPFNKKEESLTLLVNILGQEYVHKERTTLAEIADLLGHLPMAIAIAAGHMKSESGWSATGLLQRVRQDQRRLSALTKGNQHIRLSFELSYKRLSSHYKAIFTALGLFTGEDFSIEAVANVVNESLLDAEDHLQRLHNFSLISPRRNGRYHLHPLLRDYSREQNCPPDFVKQIVIYFINYIKTYSDNYSMLETEMNNILGTLTLAFEQNMKLELVEGMILLYPFLQARGLYDEAYDHLKRAETVARNIQNLPGLATILKHLGTLAVQKSEYTQAYNSYLEALNLVRETKNIDEEKILLTKLGVWAYRQGDYEQARQYYDSAMKLAQQTDDRHRIAILLTNLGIIADDEGDMEQAGSWYLEALKTARKLNDKTQLHITVLQNLGDIMDKRGNYDTATKYLKEGLKLAQEMNNPELESRFLLNLGLVAYGLNNYSEASGLFRKGIALAQRSNLILQMSRHFASLARVETAQSAYQNALLHYHESLKLARQLNSPGDICKTLNLLGECYLEQKQLHKSTESFDEAHKIALQLNLQLERAKSLYGLARIAEQWGNIELAYQRGSESATILAKAGHKRAGDIQWWLKGLPKI